MSPMEIIIMSLLGASALIYIIVQIRKMVQIKKGTYKPKKKVDDDDE